MKWVIWSISYGLLDYYAFDKADIVFILLPHKLFILSSSKWNWENWSPELTSNYLILESQENLYYIYLSVCLSHLRSAGSTERTSSKKKFRPMLYCVRLQSQRLTRQQVWNLLTTLSESKASYRIQRFQSYFATTQFVNLLRLQFGLIFEMIAVGSNNYLWE